MAVAFVTIARRGLLAWYELIGVLLRDILAVLGFVATWLLRRPVALPARAGGKAVTIASCSRWWRPLPIGPTLVTSRGPPQPLQCTQSGITAARRRADRRGPRAQSRNNARHEGDGAGMRLVVIMLVALSLLVVHDGRAQQFQPPKSGRHGARASDCSDSACVAAWISGIPGSSYWNHVGYRRPVYLPNPAASLGGDRRFQRAQHLHRQFRSAVAFHGRRRGRDPYVGLGLGVAGRENCGADPNCPDLWLNTVFGFELHYRSTFNWLVEYRGMDQMRRHRLYVGLTTRRGN